MQNESAPESSLYICSMHQHFLLFKPYGYVSQFKTDVKNKKLLGDLYPFPPGTMAIGRLDEDSEGLLLLTTDGVLSERIRSRNVEKEYYVQLDGIITEDALNKLKTGVELSIEGEKFFSSPCVAQLISTPDFPERARKVRDDRHGPTCWVSIILTEGKNRQVRKMTAAVGFPTLRLVRVRIGGITLMHLNPGEVKEVDNLNEAFTGPTRDFLF